MNNIATNTKAPITLTPPVHQNELAVAASEDWVLLPSFYLLQVSLEKDGLRWLCIKSI